MKRLGIRTPFIISTFSGVLGFIITFFNAFSGIEGFHGSWLDFILYLGEGILDAVISFGIVFVIVGSVAFFACSYLDARGRENQLRKEREALQDENTEKNKS